MAQQPKKKAKRVRPPKPPDRWPRIKTTQPIGKSRWIKSHWRFDAGKWEWVWVEGHWSA